jgi:hypothetical protein
MSFAPLTQLDVTLLFQVTGTRNNRAVDAGPAGIRIYTWIDEARFEGDRLRGRVEPGPSTERATVRPDGVVASEVHLLLITDDDAEIVMRYTATAVPTASGYSVKNFPIFETADPRYAWLNTVQAVTLYAVENGEVTPRDVYQINHEGNR